MRLTVYTDYALRLLMYLAVKNDGSRPSPRLLIATEYRKTT